MARPRARLKVGVLISGRGSNLQALIEAAADPAYPADIVLVISNQPGAPGLARAAEAGIAHRSLAQPSREVFAVEADAALRHSGVELVALAGFMRILDTGFVEAWRDRLAAAGLPGAPPAAPSARRRGPVFRLHRSFRPRVGRFGADHRPGGRAGAWRR